MSNIKVLTNILQVFKYSTCRHFKIVDASRSFLGHSSLHVWTGEFITDLEVSIDFFNQ